MVPEGFSFLIRPNNRYAGGIIQENFGKLSFLEQAILEQQILKCDIVKDFYITPEVVSPGVIDTNCGYIVAEFNYLEFSDQGVDFKFVKTTIPYQVILGQALFATNYIQAIDTTNQTKSALNSTILYEMNVDKVSNYHAGNEIYEVPISNGSMCSGLNTVMVAGYSGSNIAQKWQMNSGLNVEYLADEFAVKYRPGNAADNIPLSNELINAGLNAEILGGSGYTAIAPLVHIHPYSGIADGARFKKPINTSSTTNKLTDISFKDGAFTKEKLGHECFFARNDDLGGKPMIVTGQTTVTTNYTHIAFNPQHPALLLFSDPPDVMIQIIDDGTGNYDGQHIKLEAVDITPSHFTVAYTIYQAADTVQYKEQVVAPLTIQFVAWGYGV